MARNDPYRVDRRRTRGKCRERRPGAPGPALPGRHRAALLATCLLLAGPTVPAHAQEAERADAPASPVASPPPTAQEPARSGASTFLPVGHWGMEAARRLDALGLLPGEAGWSERSLTSGELERLFRAAAARAEATAPGAAGLARGYLARFQAELGAVPYGGAIGAPGRLRVREAALVTGHEAASGRVAAGIGYSNVDDWTGVRPLTDRNAALLGAVVDVALEPGLALRIQPAWSEDGLSLREGQVAAQWGAAGFWAGRREIAFGPGTSGGIVLGSDAVLDGGGFFLAEPLTLPGPLRHLGPVRFELFLSRIENGDRIGRPWLSGMRGVIRPHPRWTAGLSRGIMFGGVGNTPFSVRTLAAMLVGKHSGLAGEFDNQVVGLDLRFRPPLGALPVVAYLEWGLDDSAGAWRDVPGILAGVELAAVPGLPALALQAERTFFSESCCGNTIWYRNWAFRGGWADDGRPLGQALGGHGGEWLLGGRADLYEARLRIAARGFTRRRGDENLFAPERVGRSHGGVLSVEGVLAPWLELRLLAAGERGEGGWRQGQASTGLTLRLR